MIRHNYLRLKFPTELEFEPVQVCNAKCFCCPYTTLSEDPEYVKQKMTREQIDYLLTDFGSTLQRHHFKGETVVNPFRYSDPLICKHLDLVLDKARQFDFRVQITTNAKGFNKRNIELLKEYRSQLRPMSVSILGSTSEEVRDAMDVDLEHTFAKLAEISKHEKLRNNIEISLRVINGTDEERKNLLVLKERFNKLGIAVGIKSNWLHNRIDYYQDVGPEVGNYVIGCGLYKNKLLRRMEIMVNGNVVLCDDDAEGKVVFGNVFESSIEEIWNGKLRDYHRTIFQKDFTDSKRDLICNQCSRAQKTGMKYAASDSIKYMGIIASSSQFVRGNFEKIS